MAKFEPGHLHIERHALTSDDVSYNVYIDYEVTQDTQGRQGDAVQNARHHSGQGVRETFYLPKDQAYNFASNVTKIAEKYGIPKTHSSVGSQHKHWI